MAFALNAGLCQRMAYARAAVRRRRAVRRGSSRMCRRECRTYRRRVRGIRRSRYRVWRAQDIRRSRHRVWRAQDIRRSRHRVWRAQDIRRNRHRVWRAQHIRRSRYRAEPDIRSFISRRMAADRCRMEQGICRRRIRHVRQCRRQSQRKTRRRW